MKRRLLKPMKKSNNNYMFSSVYENSECEDLTQYSDNILIDVGIGGFKQGSKRGVVLRGCVADFVVNAVKALEQESGFIEGYRQHGVIFVSESEPVKKLFHFVETNYNKPTLAAYCLRTMKSYNTDEECFYLVEDENGEIQAGTLRKIEIN
ncbi:hypothetical protein [Trichormus variabilis]|uniref:Uncharacterized protein n=1 Tax=Trichormus variabilis NIES-23 TaxID=1973479 RepID=A0A1Z4KX17_ANAVA|nr:hypothetical protein [Trichormus variabilis]MBD2352836.1 hypothetical protein [Trichormus variabilis FACHB-171]BAY73581.1 hypothetical protein NIES23_64330 [Trichormus variabilis NIES-23]